MVRRPPEQGLALLSCAGMHPITPVTSVQGPMVPLSQLPRKHLVLFPVAVMNYPDQSSLKEKGFAAFAVPLQGS